MIGLLLVVACGSPAQTPPTPRPVPTEAPVPLSDAEHHARNLRFRDNPVVFEESAAWLAEHPDESLPTMERLLAERGPAAIGIARVLGEMGDPRAVAPLEAALAAEDDALAFEAARALSRIPGPEAAAALERGARSEAEGVVKNALRGIELRADPSLCGAVVPHLGAAEPIGSYARRAADALGCG